MGVTTVVVLSFAMVIALVMPCGATQYVVGGTAGWDASTDYNSWLQGKSFTVGDNLFFQYSSLHSVMVVSKPDYDSCQTSNALQSYSSGITQITISKPGNMYFICGTPGHCAAGMKLAINAQAAPAAASPPANGGSPAGSPASAPIVSPASAAVSPSPAVSSTPSGTTIAPASSTAKSPATSSTAKSPATQLPVTKSAATSISKNQGWFFVLLTGLFLLFSCF